MRDLKLFQNFSNRMTCVRRSSFVMMAKSLNDLSCKCWGLISIACCKPTSVSAQRKWKLFPWAMSITSNYLTSITFHPKHRQGFLKHFFFHFFHWLKCKGKKKSWISFLKTFVTFFQLKLKMQTEKKTWRKERTGFHNFLTNAFLFLSFLIA